VNINEGRSAMFFFFMGLIEEDPDKDKSVELSYIEMKHLKEQVIKSCIGDLQIICNAMDDYAKQLEEFIADNEMHPVAVARYEIHADRCRKISNKIADQIGYDKAKALEKCMKRQEEKQDDIGEDALALAAKGKKNLGS
jgi:2-hydroxy-3-keto-5-methylthiopentenyl-1-phosphate phosphatase